MAKRRRKSSKNSSAKQLKVMRKKLAAVNKKHNQLKVKFAISARNFKRKLKLAQGLKKRKAGRRK